MPLMPGVIPKQNTRKILKMSSFYMFFRRFSAKNATTFAQNSNFLKKILTPSPTSSYENQTSRIKANFRIKRARISNYRGTVFLRPSKSSNFKIRSKNPDVQILKGLLFKAFEFWSFNIVSPNSMLGSIFGFRI